MTKTISSIKQTKIFHPAVGPLYKVTFTDDSVRMIYGETFLHQFDHDNESELIGKELNMDNLFEEKLENFGM